MRSTLASRLVFLLALKSPCAAGLHDSGAVSNTTLSLDDPTMMPKNARTVSSAHSKLSWHNSSSSRNRKTPDNYSLSSNITQSRSAAPSLYSSTSSRIPETTTASGEIPTDHVTRRRYSQYSVLVADCAPGLATACGTAAQVTPTLDCSEAHINDDPSQLQGCVATQASNAAFNIWLRNVSGDTSWPWPGKNWTFYLPSEHENTLILNNASAPHNELTYFGLPPDYKGCDSNASTKLSMHTVSNDGCGPAQRWWLCAPPGGTSPANPDRRAWEAQFYFGQTSVLNYCHSTGQLYNGPDPSMPDFFTTDGCGSVQLLVSIDDQYVWNSDMTNNTAPADSKRNVLIRQVLNGSPTQPEGESSDPRCNDTQTSPFRLVEIPLINGDGVKRMGFNWTAALLPTGMTLWTMQDGILATVGQGAADLRLIVNTQPEDGVIQTTSNANWADIKWNTGWSLCGELQQLEIGGSTIFADCGDHIKFDNVSTDGDGGVEHGDGIDLSCQMAVLLAIPAGWMGNPNTKRSHFGTVEEQLEVHVKATGSSRHVMRHFPDGIPPPLAQQAGSVSANTSLPAVTSTNVITSIVHAASLESSDASTGLVMPSVVNYTSSITSSSATSVNIANGNNSSHTWIPGSNATGTGIGSLRPTTAASTSASSFPAETSPAAWPEKHNSTAARITSHTKAPSELAILVTETFTVSVSQASDNRFDKELAVRAIGDASTSGFLTGGVSGLKGLNNPVALSAAPYTNDTATRTPDDDTIMTDSPNSAASLVHEPPNTVTAWMSTTRLITVTADDSATTGRLPADTGLSGATKAGNVPSLATDVLWALHTSQSLATDIFWAVSLLPTPAVAPTAGAEDPSTSDPGLVNSPTSSATRSSPTTFCTAVAEAHAKVKRLLHQRRKE